MIILGWSSNETLRDYSSDQESHVNPSTFDLCQAATESPPTSAAEGTRPQAPVDRQPYFTNQSVKSSRPFYAFDPSLALSAPFTSPAREYTYSARHKSLKIEGFRLDGTPPSAARPITAEVDIQCRVFPPVRAHLENVDKGNMAERSETTFYGPVPEDTTWGGTQKSQPYGRFIFYTKGEERERVIIHASN
ncbi:hypothetical protein SKAU_G00041230 [Synaphobranchus kaupii]|uniref:Uncharacterized protein n=1 Tax=Synaphobranchus kaupii TaxID=118154 RepID=A0A9Q1G210_SYNKA|nr:hypothetical protein SKAU_G00041230 [Synaphobranchus kaupii]